MEDLCNEIGTRNEENQQSGGQAKAKKQSY